MFKKYKLDWIWFKLSYPFRFAHHPLCDRYADQRFEVAGVHLCQGCTLVTIGTVLAALVSIITTLIFGEYLQFMVIFALISLLPAIIVDGFRLSRKYKRIARFGLGVAFGIAVGIITYSGWTNKLIFAGVLIVGLYGYRKFRQMTPKDDLCQTCPHLKEAPYCPGYQLQMNKNKEYKELAFPILESDLQARMKQLQINSKMTDIEL